MNNKTLIVIPGATQGEIDHFIKCLSAEEEGALVSNKEINIYKVRNGELFEVVESLEKYTGRIQMNRLMDSSSSTSSSRWTDEFEELCKKTTEATENDDPYVSDKRAYGLNLTEDDDDEQLSNM